MPRTIKIFADGTSLEYDAGKFDDWCVYLRSADGRQRRALRDVEYFTRAQELSQAHGVDVFYADFVTVYDATTGTMTDTVHQTIDGLSVKYGGDQLSANKVFTTLYATMVAEEVKAFAVLKKRIKRLGLYQVLFEDMPVEVAANFSKGKKVAELAPLCKARGF